MYDIDVGVAVEDVVVVLCEIVSVDMDKIRVGRDSKEMVVHLGGLFEIDKCIFGRV